VLLFIFKNLFIDMLLLTVPFMIPAVYQYMLSQHRDVGSYLKLGGQFCGMQNQPPLVEIGLTDLPKPGWAPISFVPAAKVFRAILSS
jgi:hypothetical protein